MIQIQAQFPVSNASIGGSQLLPTLRDPTSLASVDICTHTHTHTHTHIPELWGIRHPLLCTY